MEALAERHRQLVAASARPPRARDAAAQLGTTEAALVACGATGPATPLRPDWAALVAGFGALGRVMALTRNDHAVHERQGRYEQVSSGPGHILVLGPDIDLRLFPGRWAHAYALGGARPSIQIFDRDGVAAHKVFTTEATDQAAWAALVACFATATATPPPARPVPAAPPPGAASPDAAALRAGWQALRDTHDFATLLKRHGVSRGEAYPLAGPDFALSLPPSAFDDVLSAAAGEGLPLMIFVGNRAAIQIHSGPIARVVPTGPWINVLDPDFNLHLDRRGIAGLWRVRKPTDDGVVTSLELLDAAGAPILMMFGLRKPGQAEDPAWRALAEGVPA